MYEQAPVEHKEESAGQQPADEQVSKTGRLATQQAIINAELFWYGALRSSDDIHASNTRPAYEDEVTDL